jgi:DNA repair protein RadC
MKKNTLQDMPEQDRPYEKCLRYGPEILQDEELLAVILRTGTVGCSVLDTARGILNRARGTRGLLAIHQLSVKELQEIPGVGQVKAIQIRCLSELCKRLSGLQLQEGESMNSPEYIAGCYMERLRHEKQETIYLLLLDKKNHLLGEQCISRGTVDASVITPREIMIEALKWQAVNLILLHNHPSGNPSPSREDILLTERIRQSAEMIGLHVVDHIVIGDQTYYSFAENDMLHG